MSCSGKDLLHAWLRELDEDIALVSKRILGVEMSASTTAVSSIIHRLARQYREQ